MAKWLVGEVALVSGATNGIGQATAARCAADVFLAQCVGRVC
jgi:NAD(P)-dependent dehydrogenase (short-subunit alcohol dehydrogenase family)